MKKTKNIPTKIYLQWNPGREDVEDFNELAEVTWCADKIYDNDIIYYRHKNSSPVEPEVIKKNADGLLPCPFCARTNMKIIAWDGGYYTVVCKCGIEAPKDSVSKNGAIRIWNRRR